MISRRLTELLRQKEEIEQQIAEEYRQQGEPVVFTRYLSRERYGLIRHGLDALKVEAREVIEVRVHDQQRLQFDALVEGEPTADRG